jgi:23S rRNA pseudouridine2605 synthase
MHPSSEIEREYLVRLRGNPPPDVIRQLLQGVQLEDGPARFDRVTAGAREGSNASFRVVLHEGRNREVRRMWRAMGFEVSRLLRIRYGPVELPRELKAGTWRLLSASQISDVKDLASGRQRRLSSRSDPGFEASD